MEKERKDVSLREAFSLNLRAFRLLRRHFPALMASRLVLSVWSALTPYAGIYLSARIIGELAGNRDARTLVLLAVVTLAAEALISLGSALLTKWRDSACAGQYFQVHHLLAKKMLELDFAQADDPRTHALLSLIRQNRNGGGWGLDRVIRNMERVLSYVFTLLGGLTLTATLFASRVPENAGSLSFLNHPLCSLAAAGLMLAVTLLAPALAVRADGYFARRAGDHNLGNRLFGFYGWLGYEPRYAADMRIYRQDRLCDKYNSDKKGTFGSQGAFAHLARGPVGLCRAASAAVSALFTLLAYAFVCLKAWAGAFGVGEVTQYIAAITKLSGGISGLAGEWGDMRNNAAFLRPVFEFLDLAPEHRDGAARTALTGQDTIEFRHVSFRYPGTEAYALRDVNLTIRAGQRLAVVGQNGSGKTTFIKLLCRLYDPTEGQILLNGRGIREYDTDEYMKLFSVVFQDFRLFAWPLGQNVAAKEDYDKALVETCLEKAGFAERLSQWPKGTETWLYKNISPEGVDVSGGEAQKLALARTLYKSAPFVILDEPTAALDPLAEADVYSRFNDLISGNTAIYISHRLSSCRFCGDILVFHEGKVVQRGSHEELTAKEGKYAELWNAQAQYYRESAST